MKNKSICSHRDLLSNVLSSFVIAQNWKPKCLHAYPYNGISQHQKGLLITHGHMNECQIITLIESSLTKQYILYDFMYLKFYKIKKSP